MARVRLDKQGVAEVLKSPAVRAELSRRMDRVQSAAKSSPDLKDVTINRRDYIGFDRARSSIGIPASIEARTGVLMRALSKG